jgi:hypothetical protein
MDYTLLDSQAKGQITQQRVAQLEAEHWQRSLRLIEIDAMGPVDGERYKAEREQVCQLLADIEIMHAALMAQPNGAVHELQHR